MSTKKPRVCIIGAGPSGMCALYRFKLLGNKCPDVECYEKQETWGGQWNFTWRTGTDEYGELVASSVYRHMWTIGAKENAEFIDYSFNEHFGRSLPSYVPSEAFQHYLNGRMTRGKCGDLSPCVHFRHAVQSVEYRDVTDDFLVCIRDLRGNADVTEVFTHVIVANGKYSVPDTADFPGLQEFPGIVMHSHDFKDAKSFRDQTVLVVGGRYSAGEIAIQLYKFGAKRVVTSSKLGAIGFKWPEGIEDRQLVERFDKKTAIFKDGSSVDVDAVIFCTGYIYHQPFLAENLRFGPKTHTSLHPDNLYKGTVWMKGGNSKLFLMAAYEEYIDFGLFDVQAEWICQYIMGTLEGEPVSREEMLKNVSEWQEKVKQISRYQLMDIVNFQRDFALMLCRDVKNYPEKYFENARDNFETVAGYMMEDILTYKDKPVPSIYTGEMSPAHRTPYMECKENDSLDSFLEEGFPYQNGM